MSSLQDPTKKFQLLTKILKRFKVFPAHVACLGVHDECGLDQFAESQLTWGTVFDKEQLDHYKEKFPTAKLYAHSLSGFRFPSKMQLIYALQGQFQELSTLKQREKVLQKCLDHLEPYGLVVFDLHTNKAYDEKNAGETIAVCDDEVVISKQSFKKGVLSQETITFIKSGEIYERHDTSIKQILLSMSDIKKLCKGFDTVEFLDNHGRKANAKSKHIVAVAQKGWGNN